MIEVPQGNESLRLRGLGFGFIGVLIGAGPLRASDLGWGFQAFGLGGS